MPDIPGLEIARGVPLPVFLGKIAFPGALGHHDEGVAPLFQAAFQVGEQTALAVQIEVGLGDQDIIDLPQGQGGGGGDEPGKAAHELHQADAVGGADGLGVGRMDGFGGHLHRGVEPEGAAHQGDVIVDGLGDDDDADAQFPAGDLLADLRGRPAGCRRRR